MQSKYKQTGIYRNDIRSIRKERANGATLALLAAKYNTSQSYISNIVHKRRWAFI